MAKVYIDAGHGGADSGAVGYIKEKDVNLVEALACRDYLKAHGVDVKMSRTTDVKPDLNAVCAEVNKYGADLAVSIHNNAGGGDGFEVYHTYAGGKGKELAKNIETEVKEIGQNSRGLKTKKNSSGTDYYGFIRMTKCPAVICEGVFVDNEKDAKISDTAAEQKAFGVAYAKGILKTLGIKENDSFIMQHDAKARKKADSASDVLYTIPKGTTVTGVLDKDGWLKATYKGKTVYIKQKVTTTYFKKI